MDENWFFKFYKNYEEILRALNESMFYFHVDDDPIMLKLKTISTVFKSVIINEVYGSIFYLFMRDDEVLIDNIYNHLK